MGTLCQIQAALESVPGIPSHLIPSGPANSPGATGSVVDGGGSCLRSQPPCRAVPTGNCAPCWGSAPLPFLGTAPGLWQRASPHPGLSLALLSDPGAQLSPQDSRVPRVLGLLQLQLLEVVLDVVQEPRGAPAVLLDLRNGAQGRGGGGMGMFPLSLHEGGKGQPGFGSSRRILPTPSWLLLAWRSAMDTGGSSRWLDTHPPSHGHFTGQCWTQSLWRWSEGLQGFLRPQPPRDPAT